MSTGGDDSFNVVLALDAGPAAPAVAQSVQMFTSILNVLKEARREADAMADSSLRLRDSMRDISALRGGTGGVSDEMVRGQLKFMQATGMTATEAHSYVEQFLGEAAAYQAKAKSPEEFERIQQMTAQYGMSQGVDPGTMAKLSGRILSMGGQGQTAESVLGTAAEVFRRINLGSGQASLATQAYTNAAASLVMPGGGGQVGSMESLAALAMGASRSGSEAEISTRLQQFSRAMTGTAGSEGWNKYVREGLSIPEGTKAEVAMRRIFGEMEKVSNVGPITGTDAEVAGKIEGLTSGTTKQGRDLSAWLREQGMMNSRERQAVIAMYAQRQSIYAELEGKGPDPRATADTAKGAIGTYRESREGRMREAQAMNVAAEVDEGMKNEELRIAATRARANLLRKHGAGWVAETAVENIMLGKMGTSAQDIEMFIETRKELAKRTGEDLGQNNMSKLGIGISTIANFPELVLAHGRGDKRAVGEIQSRIMGSGQEFDAWRGIMNNDLQRMSQEAADRQAVGDIGMMQVMGGQGRHTYDWYREHTSPQDVKGQKWLAEIGAQLQREASRPKSVPTKSAPEKR